MPVYWLAVALIMLHTNQVKTQWLIHCRLAKGLTDWAGLSWAWLQIVGFFQLCSLCVFSSGNSRLPWVKTFPGGDGKSPD